MPRGKPLDEFTKQLIVNDYIQSGLYMETAKRFNLDQSTVQKICEQPRFMEYIHAEQQKNMDTIAEYLAKNRKKTIKILDRILDIVPDKLEDCSAVQLCTVLGILTDKYMQIGDTRKNTEAIDRLDHMLDEFREAVGKDVIN